MVRKLIFCISLCLLCMQNAVAQDTGAQFETKFSAGEITLTCGNVLCAGRWGSNKRDLLRLSNTDEWVALAKQTADLNYKHVLGYYYLAKAAIKLGYFDAAEIYITRAKDKSVNQVCMFGNCEGLNIDAEFAKFNQIIIDQKVGVNNGQTKSQTPKGNLKRDNLPNRIALIIGNSNYQDLGVLPNTLNDAKAIEKSLSAINFKTKLVLDGNEATIKREIKNFANESSQASLALVFYAGHGAQISGENFLLPVDMEIPKSESDVQFSAIKVDNVINSLNSKVKVVFLDACRDNPALRRSLVKGRGAFRGGLAPANSIQSDESGGGGVFVAYATDAGNVALDGEGQVNSPFTSALLRHIKRPVSIDDMFSMVTKDVRESTKNSQRPYKYASLDGVFCLTGVCDIQQLDIDTPNLEIKEKNKSQTDSNISRSNAWLFFENTVEKEKASLVFLDSNSIKKVNELTVFDMKFENYLNDKNSQIMKSNGFSVESYVIDCNTKMAGNYHSIIINESGKKTYDLFVGSPSIVPLKINAGEQKGTVLNSAVLLACQPEKLSLPVNAEDLISSEWEKLWTTDAASGLDLFYLKTSIKKQNNYADVSLRLHADNPASLKAALFPKVPVNTNLSYVDMVAIDRFDCINHTVSTSRWAYLDDNAKLVALSQYFTADFEKFSPLSVTAGFQVLEKQVCN